MTLAICFGCIYYAPAFGNITTPELNIRENNLVFQPAPPVSSSNLSWFVKTNLLFDLALAPNFTLEMKISPHWSFSADLVFPWWLFEEKQHCLQIFSGTFETRYYFGPAGNKRYGKPWFAGIYAGTGFFDLEWNTRGVQGDHVVEGGATTGYSHPIFKRMHLEYALSFGVLQTNYNSYRAEKNKESAWELVRIKSGQYTWMGPTRAKISLVLPLRKVKK